MIAPAVAQHINLYKKDTRPVRPGMVALSAIAAVVVGLIVWAIGNEIRILLRESEGQELLAKAADIQKQVAEKRVASGVPDAESRRKEIAELRSKVEANRELLVQFDKGEIGSQVGHSRAMGAIATASEKGLWLTSLDITKAGQRFVVSGNAYGSDSVLRFSRRLNDAMQSHAIDYRFSGVEITKSAVAGTPARGQAGVTTVDPIRFTLN